MGQSETRCCSCCADDHLPSRSTEHGFASTLPMDMDEQVAWPPPNAPQAVSDSERRETLGGASVRTGIASPRGDNNGQSEQSVTKRSKGESAPAAWEQCLPETKRVIKKFVQSMVKGQQIDVVVAGSQKQRTVVVSLNRELDCLTIKGKMGDKNLREIPLAMVDAVHVGAGAPAANGHRDAESMLVTLKLCNQQCIKFCAKDKTERDALAMCLTLFSDRLRKKTTRV